MSKADDTVKRKSKNMAMVGDLNKPIFGEKSFFFSFWEKKIAKSLKDLTRRRRRGINVKAVIFF